MSKVFNRGFETAKEENRKQEEARENAGKKLWRFFLKDDGDEADLRFLTEEPVNFFEHTLKGSKGGKEVFETYTCTGENCPFCEDGDKPTYKGAYLVIDRREFEYKDQKGKKQTGKDQIRLFVQGMKVVSQLDRISDKYGLSNRDVTFIRLGSGTQTTYTIERGDEEKLSSKEIEGLLPEKLREEYDGTMDSLYDIIEEQLVMNTKDYEPDSDENEDDEDDDERAGVIGADDDDEDEAPRSKLKSKKSNSTGGTKKLFKKPQNSVKPRAKVLLKNKM